MYPTPCTLNHRSSSLDPQPSTLKDRGAGEADQSETCLLGPIDPSFRALAGRLNFTVRRHKFNKDSLFVVRDPRMNTGLI